MFKNITIRTIGAPKKISFPNRRRVLVEKKDIGDKNFSLTCEDTFRPGNDFYILKLNTLEIELYTISNFRLTKSVLKGELARYSTDGSKIYFYNKKGTDCDISIRLEYFFESPALRLKKEITISDVGLARVFYNLNDCLEYLLNTGIPQIITDSEYYFKKKDRNLSHDKFEYRKTFYKRAKSARKELEKYFKNNL
jgi:hypothetical protein